MRRSLSIVLIAIVLFNTMGYYGFLLGLQYHNNQRQIETLDNQAETLSETISIKIPINIPYTSNTDGYQRVDGVFEYKGEFFRLVKQRIISDTLEVVLIKDDRHKKINQAFVSHARSISDKPGDTPISKDIQIIKEYVATIFSISNSALGWCRQLTPSTADVNLGIELISSVIQPPERI